MKSLIAILSRFSEPIVGAVGFFVSEAASICIRPDAFAQHRGTRALRDDSLFAANFDEERAARAGVLKRVVTLMSAILVTATRP